MNTIIMKWTLKMIDVSQKTNTLIGTLQGKIINDYQSLDVGEKLPTIRTLAKKYNVSPPTAGKAIEILSVKGWLKKKHGSGIYITKKLNLQNRHNSIQRIGFIASSISHTLSQIALEGVESVTHKHDIGVEIGLSNWNIEKEREVAYAMYERGLEGLIIIPTPRKPNVAEYLANELKDMKIIIMDLYQPEMLRSHVIFDNFNASKRLTSFLIKKNCKNIVFLHDALYCLKHRSIDDRINGYIQAINDVGYDCKIVNYNPMEDFDHSIFNGLLSQLVNSDSPPDAIMTTLDEMAFNVANYLNHIGIRVPDDIIVTGFDNWLNSLPQMKMCPTTNPDFHFLGQRSAELLLESIQTDTDQLTEVILDCPILTQRTYTSMKTKGNPVPVIT